MKKAIEILESSIRNYRNMVELYEANPGNQAVTKHTADKATTYIVELGYAVAALKAMETGQPAPNKDYAAALFNELMHLRVNGFVQFSDLDRLTIEQRLNASTHCA